LPAVELGPETRAAVVHGRAVPGGGAVGQRGGEAVVLLDGAEVMAVALVEDGWLRPTVVLGTA
jgi:hypothetical protein